jgi:hypothetical protein
MIALTPEDQPLATALTEAQERRRVVDGWAEITAVRRARYVAQMACVAPRIEENEDNGR